LDLKSIGDHSMPVNGGQLMMAMLNEDCDPWSQSMWGLRLWSQSFIRRLQVWS